MSSRPTVVWNHGKNAQRTGNKVVQTDVTISMTLSQWIRCSSSVLLIEADLLGEGGRALEDCRRSGCRDGTSWTLRRSRGPRPHETGRFADAIGLRVQPSQLPGMSFYSFGSA